MMLNKRAVEMGTGERKLETKEDFNEKHPLLSHPPRPGPSDPTDGIPLRFDKAAAWPETTDTHLLRLGERQRRPRNKNDDQAF